MEKTARNARFVDNHVQVHQIFERFQKHKTNACRGKLASPNSHHNNSALTLLLAVVLATFQCIDSIGTSVLELGILVAKSALSGSSPDLLIGPLAHLAVQIGVSRPRSNQCFTSAIPTFVPASGKHGSTKVISLQTNVSPCVVYCSAICITEDDAEGNYECQCIIQPWPFHHPFEDIMSP